MSLILGTVLLRLCLSGLFLKSEESLAICEMISKDGSIMIWTVSDIPSV